MSFLLRLTSVLVPLLPLVAAETTAPSAEMGSAGIVSSGDTKHVYASLDVCTSPAARGVLWFVAVGE